MAKLKMRTEAPLAALLLCGALLSGCSLSVKATMPAYAPVNNAELTGEVEVRPFIYPAEATLGPGIIDNTAAGTLDISQPIGEVVTNGVRREFRQAGISTKAGGKCRLEGVITTFKVDDLGYSVTFMSEIRYRLFDQGEPALLDKSYSRKFDGPKGELVPALIAINTLIGENVAQLLTDPAFTKALAESCGG